MDDDKLMDLYWNRNELKKEFADLRSEKFKLTDRLKLQQGDLARLEQKLEHLEGLLSDPDWARSILVMYQLRGLGRSCAGKIARFAEQLKQQRESKQQSAALAAWRARVNAEIAVINDEVRQDREQVFRHEEEIQSLRRSLERAGPVVRFFKKRSTNTRIAELHQEIEAFEQHFESRRREIETIKTREPPEAMGLDLGAKRLINFMIISYAQQLFISFDDDNLVTLVKEASEKSAGAVRYGNTRDCESILERIRRSTNLLQQGGDFAELMRKRAKLISEGAIFKDQNDAVPIPGTVATLFRIDDEEMIRTSSVDLLGGNYWGIATILSR